MTTLLTVEICQKEITHRTASDIIIKAMEKNLEDWTIEYIRKKKKENRFNEIEMKKLLQILENK